MQRIDLFRLRLGVVPLAGLLVFLSASLFVACGAYTYQASPGLGVEGTTDDVSYLAQYGTWLNVEPFGTVWQPSVSPDWRPFAYGHWTWSDAGWAWVSYEPYGWLVYHYGNWNFEPDIGWFWIEGSDWSPAQVEWLNYDGYCSWAPLPPAGVEWPEPWREGGESFWVVVRDRDLDRDDIGHHGIGRPPQPLHGDGRDVSYRPLGVHDFEQIAGHKVTPMELKHGPVPVYMNPKLPTEHHAMQPGEVQHEKRPPEQPSTNKAEGSNELPARTETPAAGDRAGDTPKSEAQRAKNQSALVETQRVQLHRMILPKSDQARVEKHASQIEREVLVPRNGNNRPDGKAAETKRKK